MHPSAKLHRSAPTVLGSAAGEHLAVPYSAAPTHHPRDSLRNGPAPNRHVFGASGVAIACTSRAQPEASRASLGTVLNGSGTRRVLGLLPAPAWTCQYNRLAPGSRSNGGGCGSARSCQGAGDIVPPQATPPEFGGFDRREAALPGGAGSVHGASRADPSSRGPRDRPTRCCLGPLGCQE
jgi:hypothetical protein